MAKEEKHAGQAGIGEPEKERDNPDGGPAETQAGDAPCGQAEGDADGAAENVAAESAEEAPEDGPGEDKAPLGKGKKEKKDKKDCQIEELTDRVKRQMAEFENFRKRTEKEKAGMFDLGVRSVIEQLLPIVDNFERGLAALKEEEKDNPFAQGMDKVYRQVEEMLGKLGVQEIEAVGQAFDPEYHNAVMHVEDEGAGENTVVEEFLKGYTYHGQVVRHSMVKVAN